MVVREQGFTLVEVLVAMVVIGVCLGILFNGYTRIARSIEAAREYSFVNKQGQKIMVNVSNGIGANRGRIIYGGKEYWWWAERISLENGLTRLNINVEWQGRNGYKQQTFSRLLLRTEGYE
ncbi:prepilin-type N-terminal cleavage/methylation domain-containing protein [Halothermothrix orenii]|uniref:Prepilin-type N-terminal cleavage/methylation domain protein n=1 Tax=Halothermothrix orenii (strain H 168 / OCM 544 / DSM 9562) TaxID=373903 RepID=B8CZ96_HALOH|nr:prepilin-type N-terminal cleavage/methylation domain-containing protein [Halothermothrix orenii]ACL70615.1 prepilin-type N-terminal cleavage/methylation domain protein [Halothermothrix orenii H 168]